MNKPVHVRVAEKIATLFDDEERGYLWLSMTQGQEKQAAQQEQGPMFDQAVFNDAYKLAHENPAALAEVYEKVASQLTPEQVQAIEKQAAADVTALKQQEEQVKRAEFYKGMLQYEGFKYAAAQDQVQQAQAQQAQTLSQQAPALAKAAGIK